MGSFGAGALMAIIKLVSLLISLFIMPASPAEKDVFELIKRMQLYLDKNQLEKVEEIYDDNEDKLKTNWMALERLALCFERRDKIKEAIESYRKILVTIFPEENQLVFNSKDKKIPDEKLNKAKLPLYYYKLAFLYSQFYSRVNLYTSEKDKRTYKTRALVFIDLCRKVNCEEAELKLILEQLNEKENTEKSKKFISSWYLFSSLISWQDNISLININTQTSNQLLATNIGLLIGAGKKWENNKYEYNLEMGISKGSSTISSIDPSIEYQQSSVAVNSIALTPGLYFKTWSESVLLGVSLPMMLRKGEWKVPEGYRFEDDIRFSSGLLLQSKFKVSKFFLQTRLGKQFPNPGLFWSIGLIYNL